jgi:hypothetical protein
MLVFIYNYRSCATHIFPQMRTHVHQVGFHKLRRPLLAGWLQPHELMWHNEVIFFLNFQMVGLHAYTNNPDEYVSMYQ